MRTNSITMVTLSKLLPIARHHDKNIKTQRLYLRPLALGDAKIVSQLAGDWDVASMTARIPYPYTEEMAHHWIGTIDADEIVYAIERDGAFVGLCGYLLDEEGAAEVGYWLGKSYWGQGFATEATTALIAYCFRRGGLKRLTTGHFVDNPASGRVIEKLGFTEVESRPYWCEARKLEVDSRRYELLKPRSWRDMAWAPARKKNHH